MYCNTVDNFVVLVSACSSLAFTFQTSFSEEHPDMVSVKSMGVLVTPPCYLVTYVGLSPANVSFMLSGEHVNEPLLAALCGS